MDPQPPRYNPPTMASFGPNPSQPRQSFGHSPSGHRIFTTPKASGLSSSNGVTRLIQTALDRQGYSRQVHGQLNFQERGDNEIVWVANKQTAPATVPTSSSQSPSNNPISTIVTQPMSTSARYSQPASSSSGTTNPLQADVFDVSRSVFHSGPVYTTPPVDQNTIRFPYQHYERVVHQGYDFMHEGRLMRLEDCPKGYALWAGINTYCDPNSGRNLRSHPAVNAYIERNLNTEPVPPGNQHGQTSSSATAPIATSYSTSIFTGDHLQKPSPTSFHKLPGADAVEGPNVVAGYPPRSTALSQTSTAPQVDSPKTMGPAAADRPTNNTSQPKRFLTPLAVQVLRLR